jgi:hypothetical protein
MTPSRRHGLVEAENSRCCCGVCTASVTTTENFLLKCNAVSDNGLAPGAAAR